MGTTSMLALVAFAALVVLGQAQELPPPVTGADFNTTMCGACLMTMSNLDTVMDTKDSADQVKVQADELCNHLPADHKMNCKASAAANSIRIAKCMVQKATCRRCAMLLVSALPRAPPRCGSVWCVL